MSAWAWMGATCYVAAFAIVLAFALAYLTRRTFMPYHRAAADQSWDSVPPRMRLLLLALMRAVGAAWLACVAAGALLLNEFVLSRPGMASLTLFQAYCLLALAPPVAIAAGLRRATGARTPVGSVASALGLSLLGFVLCAVSLAAD
ncbi:hypothetical protein J5226_01435 [Lysobacter sp. K5869]|uniref:hypothetical protein n=1 Tax=Lysobacter sp. K5869 TaxID=2820808 RepID=UPI001C05F086|nr:hypothetical protein [Lysobacter sp. K5869]QWP77097.1 hypothetical protein J5226_01435 [Lysobacter sp. K5869]